MRPGLGSLLLVLPLLAPGAGAGGERPNFLLIVADDLCWRDIGFAGNQDVQTPHLDALASEGMVLRGMFSPAATCSPARHALYTGLHCVRSGAYPNHARAYDGTKSVFTHLLDAGYRVALHGKQHVEPAASFPYEHIGERNEDDLGAIRSFLTRDDEQPWLLVFASNDPHGPWTRGPRRLYDFRSISVPPYLHDNVTTRRQLVQYYKEITKLDEQVGALVKLLAGLGSAEDTLVLFVSEQGSSLPYGGKWSLYDTGIRASAVVRWPGRVEPGTASDALMQYVDVAPTLLELAGIDPAKIDTGCPDPTGYRGFDGRSFAAVLRGERDTFRDHVFAQLTTLGSEGSSEPYPIRAVRDARYKLIRNLAHENEFYVRGLHDDPCLASWRRNAEKDPLLAARVEWLSRRPAEELYDLVVDPYELNDLSDDPDLTPIRARLAAQLEAWMAQQGDRGLATELEAEARQSERRRSKSGRDEAD